MILYGWPQGRVCVLLVKGFFLHWQGVLAAAKLLHTWRNDPLAVGQTRCLEMDLSEVCCV